MKNCTNCQAPIHAGDAFCSKCGAQVQVAAQAEPKAVAFQPKTVQLGPTPTQAPAPKKTKRNIIKNQLGDRNGCIRNKKYNISLHKFK